MIDITDYLIIQKPNDPNLYKIEIANLDSMFIIIGETPSELFDKINELSAEILELSAQLINEYSTKSQLMEMYETRAAIENLPNDTTILNEDDVREYISENNFATIEKTDSEYLKNSENTANNFDNAYETMNDWIP